MSRSTRLAVQLTRGDFRLDVDLAWEERVVVIFGPSGSGKSSLLEATLGLHPAARCTVELGGQCLEDPARGLIPKRTLKQGTSSQKQIFKAFPTGSQVEVVLSEIDDLGRFNFVLKADHNELDQETLTRFSDDGEDLGHNPFATFFKKD